MAHARTRGDSRMYTAYYPGLGSVDCSCSALVRAYQPYEKAMQKEWLLAPTPHNNCTVEPVAVIHLAWDTKEAIKRKMTSREPIIA